MNLYLLLRFKRSLMKKLVLATLLAGLSTLGFANNYVQGAFGYSNLDTKESGVKFDDSDAAARVAIGKDMGAVRYQGDYAYFGKLDNKQTIPGGHHHAELKAHSVGVSAIYDFPTQSEFAPYAGVRLGVNHLDLAVDHVQGAQKSKYSENDVKVGAGVLAGVQYQFNSSMALDVGAEYNYLGKIGAHDAKVSQYGATVGVRYNF